MDDTLQGLVTAQIANERTAEAEYLARMWAAKDAGFEGCKRWFRDAASEEHGHAYNVQHELLDFEGVDVPIPAVAEARFTGDVPEAFTSAFTLEQANLAQWTAIARRAEKAGDKAWEGFAQGYVDGQRKAVKELRRILRRLELAGSDACALLLFDKWIDPGK